MMEEDGYDPTCSDLLEDPDKAYQPVYVAPERLEDSFSDDLSDEDEEAASDTRENPEQPRYSASVEECGISSLNRAKYESSGAVIERGMPEDQEYHVQPLLDLTTPAYAPSQTFGSPSESPLTSSVSGGYPSPVSSIQPSLLAKEDPDRHYRPLLKSEISESPGSDVSDLDATNIETEPISREFQPHSPSPPASRHSHSPDQLNENLFEGFDEDIDDNKLNEDFEGFERDEQPESQVDGIIADIFGESDAEEEFEGFAENEVEKEIEADQLSHPSEQKTRKHTSDSDDGDEGEDEDGDTFVSDFDKIMARKREELSRKRRRNRDIEFLNDSDDMILAMISRMREAADTDRQLLAANKPATKKLKMISEVASLLRRADLKTALIENGMLSAITEWLAPLPGHTLPNLVIRDTMLSCLREFQALPTEVLQDSGIGKALMYLYKHPRETRENKDRAGKLISKLLVYSLFIRHHAKVLRWLVTC
ncbi:transcription factor SPN1 [Paragonimus westermani]|uniref:Transcription factor SPN1 n=1 Tax=Paragonimus westermani TaxID=34504 RepID=A0A5J4N3Q8_9TREM|nr:transcription factor SPN1 [Paragonimus westermani]